jgi:hypothetical protein
LFSSNSKLLLQKHRGWGIWFGLKPPASSLQLYASRTRTQPQTSVTKDETTQAKSPSPVTSAGRCQHRTAAGRQYRSFASDPSSGLCPHHAAPTRAANFREALTNNSFGALYNLLAEGRISPRRASVLAYISSLLLRTLPAIDYDNEHYGYDDSEAEEQNPAQSAANPAAQPVPPGKEPLPKTAEEFAAAAFNRKPN